MKNKVILLLVALFIAQTAVIAQKVQKKDEDEKACEQENAEENIFKPEFHGFLKSDFMFDTRQNAEAVDGLYIAYPLDEKLDEAGNDINAKNSSNMVALSSRLSMKVGGPEIWGGKTSGYVEFDFSGRSNTASVRFRRAFITWKTPKTEILFGREWHPLVVKEMFPTVCNLNTGVPFNPFNRSPQITVTHKASEHLKVIASALYQNDYVNSGPLGRSPKYLNQTNFPNLHGQLRMEGNNILVGLAGDYKKLQPRLTYTSPTTGNIYRTDEKVSSYAFMGYSRIKSDILTFKIKGIYGQNLYEHLLPGGYAVSSVNPDTGYETYTPGNSFHMWSNILIGKKLQFGVFGGYYKHLGYEDDIVDDPALIFARGANIDKIYRVSPIILYKFSKLWLWAELENTTAAYGTIDYEDKGKVIDTHNVTNHRFQFSAFLFF
jgi:hypothetical protein